MLRIDRMRLTLPAAHRDHADRIARRVGEAIGEASTHGRPSIEHIELPRLRVAAQASEDAVVAAIVQALRRRLGGER